MTHIHTLDRIYRYQRHLYDLTRPLFLFGRNRLLDTMDISKHDSVLEFGCGTARNLILLAKRHPTISLFGIDASSEMLKTAKVSINSANLQHRITLVHCLAETFDPLHHLQQERCFDKIFFSYSLSMMPTWREALEVASRVLAPTGTIHVVDFWDQEDWPKPVRSLLIRWLSLFHVRHNPHMLAEIERHLINRNASLNVTSVGKRYAFIATPNHAGATGTEREKSTIGQNDT